LLYNPFFTTLKQLFMKHNPHKWLLTVFFGLTAFLSSAQQERKPDGGSKIEFTSNDEITEAQRSDIIKSLQESEKKLIEKGILPKQSPTDVTPDAFSTFFQWPLRLKAGLTDPGYYGISNYVDQNPANPGFLRDYNCGTRTYDVSGYNHAGTDIFTYPFGWNKMNNNEVEIVAAAPGTILFKSNGNFDQNCAFCSGPCTWNAVYIKHADGSVAWYGHMKNNSLTAKAIGAAVVAGEYLGVVGSSGNSTGPHLHFEVYTNSSYTNLIDPWSGPCNSLNATSWWAAQRPYYDPAPLKCMTHFPAPVQSQCAGGEAVNAKTAFRPGATFYAAAYYRDQQTGGLAQYRIIQPNGVVWVSWNQTFGAYYSASWWYWTWILPNPAQLGTWRYEVTYAGKTISQNFTVSLTAARATGDPVKESVSPSISLMPNPASGTVTVTSEALNTDAFVRVVNNLGNAVLTEKAGASNSGTLTLDISRLAPGAYHVQVIEGGIIKAKTKLVKQ
jgi:murein DD-endopeptidase MepM/ murein hydrolase activator NlpD